MAYLRYSLLLISLVFLSGCAIKAQKAPPAYNANAHALLVGKVNSVISGWFSNNRTSAWVDIKKVEPDYSTRYVATISDDYSVLILEPGIYGLARESFGMGSLTYTMRTPDDKNLQLLFTQQFLKSSTTMDVPPGTASEFFGLMEVKAGDVIYYGDMTIDVVTLKNRPLFFVQRNTAAAMQELLKRHPGISPAMENKDWIGPPFLMAKLLQEKGLKGFQKESGPKKSIAQSAVEKE